MGCQKLTIYNPTPLPLLAPKVDLRRVSSIAGSAITQGIYRSIFHALGCRHRTESFFGLSDIGIVTTQSGRGCVVRPSSFTFRQTTSTFSGFPTVNTTAGKFGGTYYVGGAPEWTNNKIYAQITNVTFYLNGTSYPITACSFENYLAGFEYKDFATTITNNNDLKFAPYAVSWPTFYLANSSWLESDYEVLPIFSDLYDSTKAVYARPLIFAPTRPLLATPTLIADERVDQLVSLNGRSYRASYSRRRIYEAKLLLDGSACPGGTFYDPLSIWRRFLAFADAGVTLWIDRNWLCNFWRPASSLVCADMPNEISGALLDASLTRFEPRDGIQDAYELTIQIADETGCEGLVFGGVPTI